MTIKALDILPSLVLELICELLVDHDDDDRTALHAFALASKTCFEAATPQRFHQIVLCLSADDRSVNFTARPKARQRYDIRRWTELLDKYNGWRYIRRLRVTHGLEDGSNEEDVAGKWDHPHDLDLDYFLRPRRTAREPRDFKLLDNQDLVNLLQLFLVRATGLQDLVWALPQIPPTIVKLLAMQRPRCRLHMHRFQLPSLYIPRKKVPQPISDQDWALVTSSNLCTVVADPLRFDNESNVCYLEPAVMRMIGGTAPNLKHVSFLRGPDLDPRSLGLPVLRRPQWAGFYPHPLSSGPGEDHQVTHNHKHAPEEGVEEGRGALRSLILRQGVTEEEMLRYTELTDLTKLTHLTIKDMFSQVLPLLSLASHARAGDFHSLTSLCLQEMDSAGDGLPALNDILENIGALQHLCLAGFVGNDTFDIILRRHGQTLRSLHLDPYGDFQENHERKPSELLKMSAADVQRIAESCPHLIEIEIPVSRSHGDAREVAVYRALSRVRHLKRAWLHLYYWVGPDENASDDVPEEDMYMHDGWDDDEVEFSHLKDAIVDCAIDETLARSIFDIISGGTETSDAGSSITTGHFNLSWLRLEIHRRQGRFGTPGEGSSYFENLIDLFTRDWVVERRNESHGEASHTAPSPQDADSITVTELHPERAVGAAFEEWIFHYEWQHDERQKFKTAFEELWQPDTSRPEWFNEWKSFPLQVSSDSGGTGDVQDGV